MIRTHVYLTEEQARTIKLRSRQEQKPEAQVIREIVDAGIEAHKPLPHHTTGSSLLALVELGKKYKIAGPSDLSTNHDYYLYGDKA